jgi:hypothetical protein
MHNLQQERQNKKMGASFCICHRISTTNIFHRGDINNHTVSYPTRFLDLFAIIVNVLAINPKQNARILRCIEFISTSSRLDFS